MSAFSRGITRSRIQPLGMGVSLVGDTYLRRLHFYPFLFYILKWRTFKRWKKCSIGMIEILGPLIGCVG